MRYRKLGSTGTVVSTLCLGTMTFGAETDEKPARTTSSTGSSRPAATSSTPPTSTPRGESESIIGALARAPAPDVRDRVVIATKGRFPMGDCRNGAGLSRRHLSRALDASLTRLGVDDDRPLPGARLGPAHPARGDAALLRRRRTRRQDPLLRVSQLHRLAAAEGVDCSPEYRGWRRSSPCSRSTTCWPATSSARSCRSASTRASACCPGRRSAAAG